MAPRASFQLAPILTSEPRSFSFYSAGGRSRLAPVEQNQARVTMAKTQPTPEVNAAPPPAVSSEPAPTPEAAALSAQPIAPPSKPGVHSGSPGPDKSPPATPLEPANP